MNTLPSNCKMQASEQQTAVKAEADEASGFHHHTETLNLCRVKKELGLFMGEEVKKEQLGLETYSSDSKEKDEESNIKLENIWVKSEFKPQIEYFSKVPKEEIQNEDTYETDGGNPQIKGKNVLWFDKNLILDD